MSDMKPPELQRALEMLAGGDAAGAAAACAAVLQSQPDNAAAHCGLGAALRGQQKISEAAKPFRYAVDLAPDCVDALVGQDERIRLEVDIGILALQGREIVNGNI